MTSAALMRTARQRARLTRAELGKRAGVPRSVVSAYESPKRKPSLDMLTWLVSAAGFELKLELAPKQLRSTLPYPRSHASCGRDDYRCER